MSEARELLGRLVPVDMRIALEIERHRKTMRALREEQRKVRCAAMEFDKPRGDSNV